jgi:hypothetical protein
MQVNIKKFLGEAGVDEKMYPGKRAVKKCPQPGEYKSHSVVLDWRVPEVLKIDVKPGQSGKDLPDELVRKYPVCLQTPTFVKIEVANDAQAEDSDEEGEEGKTSSGGKGGGRKAKKRSRPAENMTDVFSKVIEGKIPEKGRITEMVVMGMQVSERAYERVMEVLKNQISRGKVVATDLLAEAGKFITRYTPPSFMSPKGNEDAVYKYDRQKTEPMFGATIPK